MYFAAAIQPPCASKKKVIIICCSTGTQAMGPAISSASPRQASGSLAMIRSIISALLQIKAHFAGRLQKVHGGSGYGASPRLRVDQGLTVTSAVGVETLRSTRG